MVTIHDKKIAVFTLFLLPGVGGSGSRTQQNLSRSASSFQAGIYSSIHSNHSAHRNQFGKSLQANIFKLIIEEFQKGGISLKDDCEISMLE